MRRLVIFHRGKGETYREIGAALRVIPSTVADIVRRFHSENCVESIAQSGKPSLSSTREKNRIIRKVKENLQIGVPKIVSELLEKSWKNASAETVRKTIRQTGYNGRVARKRSFIDKTNRKKRICKEAYF